MGAIFPICSDQIQHQEYYINTVQAIRHLGNPLFLIILIAHEPSVRELDSAHQLGSRTGFQLALLNMGICGFFLVVIENPPEGMSSEDICHMSEDALLDMDYFLDEDDPFGDLFEEEGFYIF